VRFRHRRARRDRRRSPPPRCGRRAPSSFASHGRSSAVRAGGL